MSVYVNVLFVGACLCVFVFVYVHVCVSDRERTRVRESDVVFVAKLPAHLRPPLFKQFTPGQMTFYTTGQQSLYRETSTLFHCGAGSSPA